jgi:hypothetical protein
MVSLDFKSWSASSKDEEGGTLGNNGSKDLLADRVEHLLLIILAEQLMDVGKLLGDGLL